jgi:hypothetical protein
MSAEKWHSLYDKSKATWDRLDAKTKSIILGYTNDCQSSLKPHLSCNGPPSSNRPPPYKPPMKTQANLHEISAYDVLLANMHDVNVHQDEYHECIQETTLEDVAYNESNTCLFNATRSSKVYGLPGAI